MANSNFVVKNGLTVGPVTIDAATGNINGIAAANISSIQNGNSNVAITANGNVTINAVGGSRIVATATGANVSGYLNIALGSITAVQPVLSKSVTWNNASVTFTALSTSITDTASAAGSNIADWQVGGSSKFSVNKAGNTSVAGTMNVTGNANVGNLGTATAIITTGNITTVNSGLVQNGTSNLSIVGGGNISASVGGTANVAVWTTTGVVLANANVTGYANIGGNANVGNLGTATIIATTANLTTINSGVLQNSTSNITVASAGNITLNVTAANNYVFATSSFAPSSNGAVQLGLTGSRWSNIWGLASSAQYADLAEYYVSDADYEPGTVVDFGGVNEVTVCGTMTSTRIAGVVSTEPGYVMNDGQAGEFTLPIALQGRVPTKVVGKVRKGDMMVSAGNGHAQSCSAPVIGSVIGKALADFDGTEGVIEVVVGRV